MEKYTIEGFAQKMLCWSQKQLLELFVINWSIHEFFLGFTFLAFFASPFSVTFMNELN